MDEKIKTRMERLEEKTEERRRIEGKVKVGELTEKLKTSFLSEELSQDQPSTDLSLKKGIAWLVLLGVIGAAIFPIIGQGYMMFTYMMSRQVYYGFTGVGVTIGLIAAAWAIMTLLKK